MSMSAFTTVPTYTKLGEIVQVYLNMYNEDTSDALPFFINAAEKTILRNLRMPSMERMVSFTLEENGTPSEGWVQLPFDYLEMKFMWTGCETIQRVPFDQFIKYRGEDEFLGRACWSINANRIYIVGVTPTTEVFMTYFADIEEISSSQESNVLLDLVPDAFVFLSVAEGFRFLMEEAKADYWENQGMKRLNQVKQQVYEAEFSGSPLVISSSTIMEKGEV